MQGNAEIDWDDVFWDQMPRLYNFFRYRIGDNSVAEDLTAQTFERAWRARHQYQSDVGGFSQWLFGIARNLAIDHLRRRTPMIHPLDDAMNVASGFSVESIIEANQNNDQLHQIVQELAPDEQELLALKYGAGLTNRTIAALTGESESNVGTRLHRIVKKLRVKWGALTHE